MKVEISIDDGNFLAANIKAIEETTIRVGILDRHKKTRKRKKDAGTKALAGRQANKVGKQGDLTLGELAVFLDLQYGVFSDAAKNFNNRDLNLVTQQLIQAFAQAEITEQNRRRIENAAIALVRNPITRKDFGDNRESTKKAKGFNWPVVDTGTFFNNIKARLEK